MSLADEERPGPQTRIIVLEMVGKVHDVVSRDRKIKNSTIVGVYGRCIPHFAS